MTFSTIRVNSTHAVSSKFLQSGSSLDYKGLYKTARWQRLRKKQLSSNPLCQYCDARGFTVIAGVVDHIHPHKGDRELFFNSTNLQSLCKRCHDSDKAREENDGHRPDIGLDGWPVDQRHPTYNKPSHAPPAGGALHHHALHPVGPRRELNADLISKTTTKIEVK